MKRGGPLRSRSARRRELEEEARPARVAYLRSVGFRCELGPVFARSLGGLDEDDSAALERAYFACRELSERGADVHCHELRKRSDQGSLSNPDNLLAAHNVCNGWVEREPRLARLLGLVVRRGDPAWEELGRGS